MRSRDSIVIQEPPVRELKKRSRHLKRACVSGCGCLVFFFVVSLLALRLITGPRSVEVTDIPDAVRTAIPLYDEERLVAIAFTSGKQQHPILETIALVPKIVLSPLILSVDERFSPESGSWQAFQELIQEPLISQFDTYELHWEGLTANASFLYDYFDRALRQMGFETEPVTGENRTIAFSSSKANGTVTVAAQPDNTRSLTIIVHIVREGL